MKKNYLLLIFILLISACSSKNIYTDINLLSGDKKILNLTGKTTWLESDQKKLKNKLDILLNKKNKTWQDIVDISTYYSYLGEYGKAVLVYENWINSYGKDPLAVHHNLAGLYKILCKNDLSHKNYSSVSYCKKAIKEYYFLSEKYKKINWYKDIVEVLLFMGDKEKARKIYNLYLKKGGKKDSLMEKNLFIK